MKVTIKIEPFEYWKNIFASSQDDTKVIAEAVYKGRNILGFSVGNHEGVEMLKARAIRKLKEKAKEIREELEIEKELDKICGTEVIEMELD